MTAINADLGVLENCLEAPKKDFLKLDKYLVEDDKFNTDGNPVGNAIEAEYIKV